MSAPTQKQPLPAVIPTALHQLAQILLLPVALGQEAVSFGLFPGLAQTNLTSLLVYPNRGSKCNPFYIVKQTYGEREKQDQHIDIPSPLPLVCLPVQGKILVVCGLFKFLFFVLL